MTSHASPHLLALRRHPIKSMCGERVASARVDERGLFGDRRYALIDVETGKVASAKLPARWGRLLSLEARLLEGEDAGAPVVEVRGPEGIFGRTDEPGLDARLSRYLERDVRLSSVAGPAERIDRLTPETEPDAGGVTETPLAAGAPGTFFDFAPLHLITDVTVAALTRDDLDVVARAARFRPNLVVGMPGGSAPFCENAWVGRSLRIGDVELQVLAPTPRCSVPSLAHGEAIEADRSVVRAVARGNRIPVLTLGTFACAGVYVQVTRGGTLSTGDAVSWR